MAQPANRFSGGPTAMDLDYHVDLFGLTIPFPEGLVWLFLAALFLLGTVSNKRNVVVTTAIALLVTLVVVSTYLSMVLTEIRGFRGAFDGSGVFRPIEYVNYQYLLIPFAFFGGIASAAAIKRLKDARVFRIS